MAGSDEDAPWLAEAAPLRARPARRPLLNIAIAVLALAAVGAVALLMLLGRKDGGSSEGYMEADQAPLIEADAGPFKIAPTDRQGMDVQGDGEVIHQAVRGGDVEAQIDMSALPEEPIGRPRDLLPPAGGTAPAPAPAQTPALPGQPVQVQVMPSGPAPLPPRPAAKPAPAAIVPPTRPVTAVRVPATAGKTPATAAPVPPQKTANLVQIGAFSSEAKALEEWDRVSTKGGLTGKRIEKLTNSNGKTMWRVRGTATDTAAACKAVLAANGACETVKK
jgi:hypothetical protein